MTNIDRAIAFLQMAGRGEARKAFETYVAREFVHHNVYFKGDRLSLLEAMELAHRTSPNNSVDVKRVYRDGETVITHSLVTREAAPVAIAVVHIFRFENDKIVELWDCGQPLPETSPNANGPF